MVFLNLCEICSESGLIRSGGAFVMFQRCRHAVARLEMFGKLRLQSEGRGTLLLNISASTRCREDLCAETELFFGEGWRIPELFCRESAARQRFATRSCGTHQRAKCLISGRKFLMFAKTPRSQRGVLETRPFQNRITDQTSESARDEK